MNRKNSAPRWSLALAIFAAVCLNASAASTPRGMAILRLNPVAYWQFSADTIEQPVLDLTQNHNDGCFEGLATGRMIGPQSSDPLPA
jgi:hypothetical protein